MWPRTLRVLRFFRLVEGDQQNLSLSNIAMMIGMGLIVHIVVTQSNNVGAVVGSLATAIPMVLPFMQKSLQNHRETMATKEGVDNERP